MLLSTGSRSQHCKQQQQCKAAGSGSRTGSKLFIALAVVTLGSVVGASSTASTTSHRFRFLPARRSPPIVLVSEPPTLGDRLKGLGGRVRGGLGGISSGDDGVVAKEGGRKFVMAGVGASKKSRDASSSEGGNGAIKSNGNGNNGNGKAGLNSFFAGGLAGSISTTITCPIEV